jgi:hypothetical protein
MSGSITLLFSIIWSANNPPTNDTAPCIMDCIEGNRVPRGPFPPHTTFQHNWWWSE